MRFLCVVVGGLSLAGAVRVGAQQPSGGAAPTQSVVQSDGPLVGAPAPQGPQVTLAADVNSVYVWRGITFAKGGVVQPSIDVSGLKVGKVALGINVWSSFNLSEWDGQLQRGQFSEVDFTLTAVLPAGFKVGYVEYVFAVGGSTDFSAAPEPSTRELMVSWSREMAVTPTIGVYYDVEQIDDFFLLASLSRGVKMTEKANLSLTAELGWAGEKFAKYYGGTKGGPYHYNLFAKATYAATAKLGVSATAGYTAGCSADTLPKDVPGLHGPYAGVGLSFTP
jgi:hypothetical protein